MTGLLLPKTFQKHRDKLYVAQIFSLNNEGKAVAAIIYPQPTNGKINGAFLSQIKKALNGPIDSMLQIALQTDDVKVMFRITELDKFLAEKAQVDTLRQFAASEQRQNQVSEGTSDESGNRTNN